MGDRIAVLATAHPVAGALAIAACAVLVVFGVLLTVVDVREHRLPDRLVLPGTAAGVVLWTGSFAVAGSSGGVVRTLAAGVVLFSAYLVLRVVHPPGMGFGDVKLAGLLGVYLGAASWTHVLAGTMFAFLAGGLVGGVLVAARRLRWSSALPFGPFMLIGAAAALVLVPAT